MVRRSAGAGATTARARATRTPGPTSPSRASGDRRRRRWPTPPGARLLDPGPAPAYELLVNFPRAKSRTQLHSSCAAAARATRTRASPLPERAPPQPRNPRLDGLGDDRDDVQPGSERTLGGSVIIPRQNKDVCRECDKALWRHCASDIHFVVQGLQALPQLGCVRGEARGVEVRPAPRARPPELHAARGWRAVAADLPAPLEFLLIIPHYPQKKKDTPPPRWQ